MNRPDQSAGEHLLDTALAVVVLPLSVPVWLALVAATAAAGRTFVDAVEHAERMADAFAAERTEPRRLVA